MIQKIDGMLVVAGHIPTADNEMGKSLSSANFQALGQKLGTMPSEIAAQIPASTVPAAPSADAAPKK
jgi:hypothetical protein